MTTSYRSISSLWEELDSPYRMQHLSAVNVIGIVTDFRSPSRLTNNNFRSEFSIVDLSFSPERTYATTLVITVFTSPSQDIPYARMLGDIVRIHRLDQVSIFRKHSSSPVLQGTCKTINCTIITFSGAVGASKVPLFKYPCAVNHSLVMSQQLASSIDQLRLFSQSTFKLHPFKPNRGLLRTIASSFLSSHATYFDTIVKVLEICFDVHGYRLWMKVWDATVRIGENDPQDRFKGSIAYIIADTDPFNVVKYSLDKIPELGAWAVIRDVFCTDIPHVDPLNKVIRLTTRSTINWMPDWSFEVQKTLYSNRNQLREQLGALQENVISVNETANAGPCIVQYGAPPKSQTALISTVSNPLQLGNLEKPIQVLSVPKYIVPRAETLFDFEYSDCEVLACTIALVQVLEPFNLRKAARPICCTCNYLVPNPEELRESFWQVFGNTSMALSQELACEKCGGDTFRPYYYFRLGIRDEQFNTSVLILHGNDANQFFSHIPVTNFMRDDISYMLLREAFVKLGEENSRMECILAIERFQDEAQYYMIATEFLGDHAALPCTVEN